MANFSLSSIFDDPQKLGALSQFLLSFGQGTLAAGQRGSSILSGIGQGFASGGVGLNQFMQQQQIQKMRELQEQALEQQIEARKEDAARRGRLQEAAKLYTAGRGHDLGIGQYGRPVAPGSQDALGAIAAEAPQLAIQIGERGKDRASTEAYRKAQLAIAQQRLALARRKAAKTPESKDAIIRLNNRAEQLRGLIAKGGLNPEVRAALGRRLKNIEGRISKMTTVTGRTEQDVAATTGARERTKAQVKAEVAKKAEIKELDNVINSIDSALGGVEKGVGPKAVVIEKGQGLVDLLKRHTGIDLQGPENRAAAAQIIRARQRIRFSRERFLKWSKTTGRVAIQEQKRILELYDILGATKSPEVARDSLLELRGLLSGLKSGGEENKNPKDMSNEELLRLLNK